MKAKTDENETNQNTTKKYTSWRRLWLINFREQTSTSTFSLSYPLFCPSRHVRRYTTTCRSPSLAFSAAIQLTVKRSAPCPSVLRHSSSSWATIVHSSALIPKSLKSSRRYPVHCFSSPPPRSPLPHHPSEHGAIRQSRVLLVRYKSRELYHPPRAHNRVDALTSRLHESVQIENRGGQCRCSLTDQCSESESCVGFVAACRSGTCTGST